MKNALLVTLFLFAATSWTQAITKGALINFNIGDKYDPAEITFTDGSTKKGFINGFIENNLVDLSAFSDFKNFEAQLNLSDRKFYFKTGADEKAVVLKQAEISKVTVIKNDGPKIYHLMDIAAVNNGKEIVDLKRKAWLPLMKEDVVSIYGFNMFINNRYVHTYTYISNDGKTAIKPADKMVGMDAAVASYKLMLRHVFKNCSALDPDIEAFVNLENAKKRQKEMETNVKAVKKDKSLSSQQEEQKVLALQQDYIVGPYVELIAKYKTSCAP